MAWALSFSYVVASWGLAGASAVSTWHACPLGGKDSNSQVGSLSPSPGLTGWRLQTFCFLHGSSRLREKVGMSKCPTAPGGRLWPLLASDVPQNHVHHNLVFPAVFVELLGFKEMSIDSTYIF